MCGGASGESEISVAELVEPCSSPVMVILGAGSSICGLCRAEEGRSHAGVKGYTILG